MSTLDRQLHAGDVRSRRRRRLAVRMLAGCLIVIAAVAATVATGTLLEVKFFTDALKQNPRLNVGNEPATAEAGGENGQAGARGQDQPRNRHQLRRVQGARRLPRVRVRASRPPLLPLEPRPRPERYVLGDRHSARLPEAVWAGCPVLCPLPPH